MNKPILSESVDTRFGSVASEPSTGERVLASEVLLAGNRKLVIEHRGERYWLRETRQGKLILTK
ncbi:MAG: hemin uptake protein HemP [Zoogloeaceae bacterium]|nr:hemin uptake protein HemP [Rhodocyclaceae bacterium]MCP5236448.1 hemin uptake protein HemP [Zoogloeaceae bacterium]